MKKRTFNLTDEELNTVKHILARHVPHCEVWAFGSRVSGKAKRYSDFDLVVVGREKVARNNMASLKEAFQTSKLPFRVDVLDWHRIPEHFKRMIKSQHELIQSSKNKGPIA